MVGKKLRVKGMTGGVEMKGKRAMLEGMLCLRSACCGGFEESREWCY